MNLIAAFRRYSELIAYKTYAELKAEASSYYLGVLWWVLEPALYLFAFYSVFRWGIRQGDKEFIARTSNTYGRLGSRRMGRPRTRRI